MPWMPLMLNLQDCRCLIAGGGKTALRKAKDLLAAEAVVTVVAPDPDPSFAALPVAVHRRPVEAEDLAGMALVVDATGDDRTGRMLARLCRERNLLFNCAADPAQGTALFRRCCGPAGSLRAFPPRAPARRLPPGCGISWREFCCTAGGNPAADGDAAAAGESPHPGSGGACPIAASLPGTGTGARPSAESGRTGPSVGFGGDCP